MTLAVDVGGTKVAAGLVDDAGHVLAHDSIPTPAAASAESLLAAVAALARRVRAEAAPTSCGVGCGGPMAGDLVSPLNIPAWRDFPLQAELASALELPVSVDNDAKALALAEGWLGAAAGRRDFIAMVVSTGVGGGLVCDGRLLDGRLGNAGHVGHVNVVPDGRRCACGASGCLEAEASGLAIAAMTGAPPQAAPLAVRERSGRLVGRAVASVANLMDLDVAVVGGSVALGFGEPFFAAARATLAEQARLDFSKGCVLVPVGLGPLAPLIGAAAVAMRAAGADWLPA